MEDNIHELIEACRREGNVSMQMEEETEEFKILQHNFNSNGDFLVSVLEWVGLWVGLALEQPTFNEYNHPRYEILRAGRVAVAIRKDTHFKIKVVRNDQLKKQIGMQ
jgi:hypothetical protein